MELASGGKAGQRLLGLSDYNLRFGLFVEDIWCEFGTLTEAQNVQFDLIMPYGQMHRRFKTSLASAPSALEGRTAEFRKDNAAWVRRVGDQLHTASKQFRDRVSRGDHPEPFTAEDLDDAFKALCINEASAVGSWIIERAWPDGRQQRGRGSPQQFLESVYLNPCVYRFIRVFLAYLLGYADVWDDPKVKGRVSPDEGDLTDMTLALYARKGDIVLTSDKKFKRVMSFADPLNPVRVSTWDEWLLSR